MGVTIGEGRVEITGPRSRRHGPPSPELQADIAALCERWRSEGREDDAAALERILAFELRLHRADGPDGGGR